MSLASPSCTLASVTQRVQGLQVANIVVVEGEAFMDIDAVVGGDDQGVRVPRLECQDFMAIDAVVEGDDFMAAVLEGLDFMVSLPCILVPVTQWALS